LPPEDPKIPIAIANSMNDSAKQVAVLGSTGSIGQSTLAVIAASDGHLRAAALSAHSRLDLLVQQAQQFQPDWVIATDLEAAAGFDWSGLPKQTRVLLGHEGLEQTVRQPEIDIVLAAIVGSAGLRSTWAAVDAGKNVALANKETLVMAGPLVMRLAAERGCKILPVDSEHSAVFQALQCGKGHEVQRIILTASGGPFRDYTLEQLEQVTLAEALNHPTWDMGPKITIDSATMMNKALEIIEARWLFDLPPEKIDVVVHPQSIVHSLVEFVDGAMLAQMSPPDMKLPIQYALYYPQRRPGISPRLDLTRRWELRFQPPDLDRFPALQLGLEAARLGGTAGAVLNAANEAAVAAFRDGKLRFVEIAAACRGILDNHNFESQPSLDQLDALDRWARQEVSRWICA
jgi:1-deoxy-D-xylulose-5-phosphate reductoisomerase